LLLAARTLGAQYGLPMAKVGEVIDATGVSKSRAYELRNAILALLPRLLRAPGRPASEPAATPPALTHELRGELLRFVMDHPGCVHGGAQRRRYTGELRRFVLELYERHAELDLPAFADALMLPLGTLEDWLRPGQVERDGGVEEPQERASSAATDPTVPKVELLLDAWRRWSGHALAPFGKHMRKHLRLDFSDALIAKLLFEHGERTPKRRTGRSPDEEALRGAFETFFAGAQWVGDGKEVQVVVDGKPHRVNLELMVDAHTGAFVGLDVREAEDSAAVVHAFEAGVDTTGEAPLALLLDNKPCNHTEVVDAALGDTLRIRATPFRPQNKAHVEGAFGLFSQRLPELMVHTDEPLAKQIARLVGLVFFAAFNHKPRHDRDGNSRVELYREPVTEEQRAEAKARLQARLDKQERARQTRTARLDPMVRERLDRAFERLGLADPERHFRDAIARHPLEDIVDAVAIFEGKQRARTLPEGADARYLLGIVNNVTHVHEADAITSALLQERLATRDSLLEPLKRRCESIQREHTDDPSCLRVLIDEAMSASRFIERLFWIHTTADLIRRHDDARQRDLFRAAARRIHATFRSPRHERSTAERRLARLLWPIG